MIKWVDYYGAIRSVRLEVNKDGLVTSYHFSGIGVVFKAPVPVGDLPSNFYDSPEEAAAGELKWVEARLAQSRIVLDYLAKLRAKEEEAAALFAKRKEKLLSLTDEDFKRVRDQSGEFKVLLNW